MSPSTERTEIEQELDLEATRHAIWIAILHAQRLQAADLIVVLTHALAMAEEAR